MTHIINKCIQDNSSICIYANRDNTSKFIFGKIIACDLEHIVISMISPDGYYDGLLLKRIVDIVRIEVGNRYANKMLNLMEKRKCIIDDIKIDKDTDTVKSVLSYAINNDEIVSIELIESGIDDVTGVVIEIKDDICCVDVINEWGENDGKTYFCIDSITQISCASSDEKRLSALRQ